jgi:hypothetical protein
MILFIFLFWKILNRVNLPISADLFFQKLKLILIFGKKDPQKLEDLPDLVSSKIKK